MNRIFIVIAVLLMVAGCKKADTSNPCEMPDIQVSADNNGGINISVANGGKYGFTNVEYGANGFAKGSGTKANLPAAGGNISGLNAGTYDVYVQGNCGGSSNSDWAGPKSILVSGTTSHYSCSTPNSLYSTVFPYSIDVSWSDPNQYSSTIFEVRSGVSGFAISSGQSQTVNSRNTQIVSGLPTNTACEFVVRTKCSDGSWSDWSSRGSFVTSSTLGSCDMPTNFSRTRIAQTVSDLSWDNVPGVGWQYSLQMVNVTPTSYTSTSQSQFTATGLTIATYYLYVRTVCPTGTSPWQVFSFTNV